MGRPSIDCAINDKIRQPAIPSLPSGKRWHTPACDVWRVVGSFCLVTATCSAMRPLAKAKLLAVSILISYACNFQYGYSSVYLNTPIDSFKAYLNESLVRRGWDMTESTYSWMWNLILNIWFVGFFFGVWISPFLNDRYGRKVGFIVMNILSLVAAIARYLATQFYVPELLFAGRIMVSVATAVTYQSQILYLQECSPTKLRGFLTFFSEISFATMCLLGMFLGTKSIFGDHINYLLGVVVIPCALFVIALFPIPETPKFLLIVKCDKVAATKSIQFFQGADADVDSVLDEIAKEAEGDAEAKSSLKEIFTTPYLRQAVILSCLTLQNTVALWSLLLSSTFFLTDVNLNESVAQWSSTSMAMCYTVGTICGAVCIERFGRRNMVITFASLNSLTLVLYVILAAIHKSVSWANYGCLVCLLMYGYTYGCGVGPISWFLSSELVPQRHRSLVQSLCYAINTLMVVITTFTVLPLYNVIGAYAFIPLYIIPSTCSLIYLFMYLPETKSREIHEIVNELKGKKAPKQIGRVYPVPPDYPPSF
ncbi:hypothetical protein QR680_000734 [Steinernema hermaphroditum]|uniref:Major facilitator superfamily (MFS) profile domain-containing protein n=1 Tax=Steinernema hermaphroditum TaxID=289476 RepID=A0AA39GVQ0_9BILA|nr:hypothetical protein QR680_000734 [Steinernema hermaphroditum]